MSQVNATSKILKYYPFLSERVLCVGGRLAHANLPDEVENQRRKADSLRLSLKKLIWIHHTAASIK